MVQERCWRSDKWVDSRDQVKHNGRFPLESASAVPLLGVVLHLLRKKTFRDKWHVLSTKRITFPSPKQQKTQTTDPNQWARSRPMFIHNWIPAAMGVGHYALTLRRHYQRKHFKIYNVGAACHMIVDFPDLSERSDLTDRSDNVSEHGHWHYLAISSSVRQWK